MTHRELEQEEARFLRQARAAQLRLAGRRFQWEVEDVVVDVGGRFTWQEGDVDIHQLAQGGGAQ